MTEHEPTPVTKEGHVIGLPPAGPPPEDQSVTTRPPAAVVFLPPPLDGDGEEDAGDL